ncbi:hypothetical protein Poli38472_001019 [Pythium oligandrum]|uniref:Uncharacterized protein n=1 Tax=Pythium oligandrum TaxID=41045 RepID=A0A8K1FST1_PYTOL|nr:hypothetical protein Poli38472_001019 [Pythium oligandrum]|eukprot:TMW68863.1 hypothetical protein Poli38472_001019 [Pythium oligandrum]
MMISTSCPVDHADEKKTRSRGSTSSERGKALRVRRKEYEENLRSRVRALRHQVADLQSQRTIWHAKILFTNCSDTGSLAQLVRHYYTLFRFGLQTPKPHLNEAAIKRIRYQEHFMQQIIDPDAQVSEFVGPQASMMQWRQYTAAHASFIGDIKSVEVTGTPESPNVIIHSLFHVIISRATFAIMFPQMAQNEDVVRKFLHKRVTYDVISRIRFTKDGRIGGKDVDVDFIDGFLKAGFSMEDVSELMQLAALSSHNTIQTASDTVKEPLTSRKRARSDQKTFQSSEIQEEKEAGTKMRVAFLLGDESEEKTEASEKTTTRAA